MGGLIFFLFIFFGFTITFLVYGRYLRGKNKLLKQKIKFLEENLNELDEQAKLIIKSDLELKLYQEEIQDKLRKLSFLKKFISTSLNILDRESLFSQISKEVIREIGFEKGAIITYPEGEVKANIDFSQEELLVIKEILKEKMSSADYIISSNSGVIEKEGKKVFFDEFLAGPIISEARVQLIFLVSKCILSGGITEAEKEIFSIICMYLGQCLDNIRSFEASYQAGEELENKIKEKTFELKKSLEELEKVSKMKSEFISSVSHELRTPLTSIKGFSSLLVAEKFGKLPSPAKERLKKIDENVDKLVSMVNTLLDISRIESRRVEIKIAPHDLVKLIKDVVDFLMPQIDNKNIKIELNLPPYLEVYMDRHLIERVLINLINNAIKFTPSGGKITVSCHKKKEKAVVSVADTGYGIAKEDLEKIFNEFFRADNPVNREVKGAGLGLSLVRRIIDIHKEKIGVESQLNKGTTFYFTLKLKDGEA